MGFKFPYGNGQQLNLNWFIKKFKELLVDWEREKNSIDGALDAEIQRAEDALSDVYTARDTTIAAKNDALQAKADALTAAANAAQYWQNAAASANSAATSAVTAHQAAQDAADNADQTSRDRAIVSADKAAVAADKATVASDKATVAADKAAVAADKAAVQQDKDDTDLLKDAANAAALRAEGWADGEQNGTPVTSNSPYYENNAKYYASLIGSLTESFGNRVLDGIMPTTEKSTSYSGRTVKTLGKKISVTRTANGSTYRWHVVSGSATNTYDINVTAQAVYTGGNFVTCKRIYGADKIAINLFADPANTFSSSVYYWVLTTGDGGQTIHTKGYTSVATAFNPASMMSIVLTADQVADLSSATPEIAIMIQTRGGYETVRGTMTTYLEMVIT